MPDNPTKTVRDNYNDLAEAYARQYYSELVHKPFDRELLDRFAREARERGEVCDMGCGPGHIARYLRDAGVSAFGLDLSPRMVEQARLLNPDISFREGDMTALNIHDGALAGIASFYAIVNLPKESISLAFREMNRTLRGGGLLLLAFHVGDKTLRPNELWGQSISMDFHLLPVAQIKRDLEAAGFAIVEVLEREPYPEVEYPSRRAYIFAHKPAV